MAVWVCWTVLSVLTSTVSPSERLIYAQAVANGVLPGGYAVGDGAAVHFVDGMFAGAVAEHERAEVSRFSASDEPTSSGVLREELDVTVL